MSKASVKKALNALEKKEIVEMVMELYSARKEAKEYLEYWTSPDSEKELEKYKKLVDRVFFTTTDKPRRAPSLSELSYVVKNFMSLCYETEKVADLLLYVAEREADWLELRYRKTAYRTSLLKNVRDAELYIETHELQPIFALRLERLQTLAADLLDYQASLSVASPRSRKYFMFNRR